MKLAPKPQPKERKQSRGGSSTQQTDKGSSFTVTPRKQKVILEGVTYTGVDSQGQAVPTAHQTTTANSESTKTSIGIITSPTLSSDEKTELYNLGVFMAQMKWLSLYSDCVPFVNGVRAGEGVIDTVGNKDDFDGVVLYKAMHSQPKQPKMVEMNDPAHLYSFVAHAGRELYRRGILR